MMDGDAVAQLRDLAQEAGAKLIETEDGRAFVSQHLRELKPETADALGVHSLQGLADYVQANVDGLDLEKVLVSVLNPTEVVLATALSGVFRDREEIIRARYNPPSFRFGNQMGMEEFLTGLQACFVETEGGSELLKVLGNIKEEQVTTQADDGVTQEVTARRGVATVDGVAVPNPVTLRPYRTFTEVDQPAIDFVVRLQGGAGGITAALHEADGGAWQQEARERIATWLGEKLPDDVTVIR